MVYTRSFEVIRLIESAQTEVEEVSRRGGSSLAPDSWGPDAMSEDAMNEDGAGEERRLEVGEADQGTRLDVFVNLACGWKSRSRIKELVKLGSISVNEAGTKASYRVRSGDVITVSSEPPRDDELLAEDIPIEIVHEDESMLVISKAPYIPVHPGAGRRTGTLANALAFHFEKLSDIAGAQRPGIVHRLDRDTSGVMCVAKTNRAHFAITSQFQERTVEKTYYAIVEGVMEFDEDYVDAPIARHPKAPTKMTVAEGGREAQTRFKVLERFDSFTFVQCFPKTGRTHQIRVHLAYRGHPIICDHLYGRRTRIGLAEIAHLSPDDSADRLLLDRQALHAGTLCLGHPLTGVQMSFEAPLPSDMENVLAALREHRRAGQRGSRR